ncbi:MAG: GAF domain-containing protein, partial [Microcoleus sp. SIO2G3]|nr:GAF domain-containing protein [Microcoleus sp. SIO2G3]
MSGQAAIWTMIIVLLALITALLGYCALHLYRSRKLQLAAAATSAAHIQAFMNSLPAPAWIDTADGIAVYHNPQMQQTSGDWNASGKSLFEMYLPEFAQQYYDNSRKVAQTQQAIEVIEPSLHPDGSIHHFLAYKFPIAGSRGEQLVGGIGIDITAQLQTQAALETLARKEQTLSRVIQTIHNSIDIMPIFAIAAHEMADLLQAYRVSIVQYRPEEKLWRRVVEHLQAEMLPTLEQDIPDQDNPIAARLKQRELVAIDDAQTLQDDINRSLAQHHSGAWLLVPLEVGTTVWGCLTVQRDRSRSPWQAWEVDFIRTVSEQLAIGLQQSQLYEQMQQLNIALEQQVQERTAQVQQALVLEAALKRITDKVRDSLDERQILQTAVQELGRLLNVTFCDTSLYDLEQQTAVIAYEYTTDVSLIAVGRTVRIADFPELYPQLLRGECLHFCLFNISQIHQIPERVPLVACPIVDDQQVLGDLWLSKQRGGEF